MICNRQYLLGDNIPISFILLSTERCEKLDFKQKQTEPVVSSFVYVY
jgi:hypothetical protein